jgi:hypothetical protein
MELLRTGIFFCALVLAGAFVPVSYAATGTTDGIQQSLPGEVAFVDSRVPEANFFVKHLSARMPVYILEETESGFEQMAGILSGMPSVDAIHIISHGEPGAIAFGDRLITTRSLSRQKELLGQIGQRLTPDGDILLYGCGIASGARGRRFIVAIAERTGADVAASDDDTGAAGLGGDWDLEYAAGEIEAGLSASAFEAWIGVLALPDAGGDVTVTDTSGNSVSIEEDSEAPSSANIRLTVPTVYDTDDYQPETIRIISVDGGSLTDEDGDAIILGDTGTELSLASGSVDLRFTPETDRDTNATFNYVLVDADGEGNSEESTATVSITAVNDAPVITSTAGTTATEDTVYSYMATATDADNDALEWSVKSGTTLPAWLTFDASGLSTASDFVTGINGSPGGVGYDENTGYTYFATTDANGTIYKADASGNASVFGTIGSGTYPYPYGNMIISGTMLYVSANSANAIYTFDLTDQSGSATPTVLASLSGPVGMALHGGQLYVASYDLNKIVIVDMGTGTTSDFFSVSNPCGLVFDDADNCFVSQLYVDKILKRTSEGVESTVATLTAGASDIKIGANGKYYVTQKNAADLRIYESDFSTYQSIAVKSWGMTFNNSGTLIFGEYGGSRLLKLETGAVLSGTPTNDDVGANTVALSLTDGVATVDQEFTIAVVNTNDAPVLDNSGSVSLTSVTEDATDPAGNTVSSIVSDLITDADSGAVEGVAVTGVTGDGTWQYNIGSGWTDVGTVSGTSALLLSTTAYLRFVPTASVNNAQTATVIFRAWDQSSGSAGTKVDVSTNGGTTAFSTAAETASLSVTEVNDAPVIEGQSNLHSAEDTSLTITLDDLTVTDPDNTYPDDFSLSVQDGTNYTRTDNTITPTAGLNGVILTVPVTVNDGTDDSNVYNLSVYVATERSVTNTDDSGAGSLRQTLADAGDGDLIDLSGVTGTITLTGGGLTIGSDVEIIGSEENGIVIDGNSTDRVLEISAGIVASLSDATITNGSVDGNGGGIYNGGELSLTRVTVSGNAAASGTGGGINNAGTLTMKNCTVSGNSASGEGGGINNETGRTLSLNNCTIASNSSSTGTTGGLYNAGGLDIRNTLIADNSTADFGNSGTIDTNTNNLVENGELAGALSEDPGLGLLQDNGGSGYTHGLAYGSIAIDAGDSATAETTDQRGTSRPVDGNLDENVLPDIGAFEYIPGVIEFSAATYSVDEDGGSIAITVIRTGTGDGAVSADYATSDGTAMAGSDYIATSGTLTWSSGDTSEKTFSFSVTDDLLEEDAETVSLALDNITGAGTGSIVTAGLTIADDDVYYTLTTTADGDGSGSITSSSSGIDCGDTCSAEYYAGTTVTLTTTPDDECSVFSGWSGGECTGTGPCSFELTEDTTVTAVFGQPDSDGDGTIDCEDAFPEDPDETADGDGDGIGDNADTDHDNDGMPTAWENANGLDPLTDDADLDPDGDGLSNLEEYEAGTDPQVTTTGLGRAVLVAPADGATGQSVTPTLETTYGDDAYESVHAKTRWQIASDADFSDVVMDITSAVHTTDLTVPVGVLDPYLTYFWRARYVDTGDGAWPWAESWTFTTTEENADDNGNGLPDDQELAEGTESDLNGDGEDDLSEADMHCVTFFDGSGWTCLEDESGGSVEELFAIDPEEIPESDGAPDELPYGLFGFRLAVNTPGDSVTVAKYYSVALPEDISWYKYDSVNGWFDYTGYVSFSEDRKVVFIELTDGGYGDADGVANGVVVDPSGPAMVLDAEEDDDGGGGSDADEYSEIDYSAHQLDDGICFISTISGGVTGLWGVVCLAGGCLGIFRRRK